MCNGIGGLSGSSTRLCFFVTYGTNVGIRSLLVMVATVGMLSEAIKATKHVIGMVVTRSPEPFLHGRRCGSPATFASRTMLI
jgi:hypothetical protein